MSWIITGFPIFAIVFIIAIIVGLSAHQIPQLAFPVIIAVMLHNGLGLTHQKI